MTEALPQLVRTYLKEGSTEQLEHSLTSLLKKNPALNTDIAYTAIVNGIEGVRVIDTCVEEYLLNEPTLAEFVDLQSIGAMNAESRSAALARVRSALSKIAQATPRYQCKECGFSSQRLLWQCPSCKDWETQRPFSRVQFDSLLQRGAAH
jgi:lipopolysaccharide biosynthesis regulator YciM